MKASNNNNYTNKVTSNTTSATTATAPTKFLVKLISIGDVEVGKSCLIKRYCEGQFIEEYVTTIGIDYGVKQVIINDNVLAVNIFDLSGDDVYKTIRKEFYSDAIGVLMVYDVNIKTTFDSLKKWEKEAEANGLDLSKCVVFVMGNKSENKNKKEVNTQVAKDWAKSKGYSFYETSAKTGLNIFEGFKSLFEMMFNRMIEIRSRYVY